MTSLRLATSDSDAQYANGPGRWAGVGRGLGSPHPLRSPLSRGPGLRAELRDPALHCWGRQGGAPMADLSASFRRSLLAASPRPLPVPGPAAPPLPRGGPRSRRTPSALFSSARRPDIEEALTSDPTRGRDKPGRHVTRATACNQSRP